MQKTNSIKFRASIAIFFLFQLLSIAHAYSQVSTQDSLALVALYDATDGDHWFNKTNWKQGNVSTWYGIDVHTISKRVRRINLDSNNLHGQLPDELAELTELVDIFVSSNHLKGIIPLSLRNHYFRFFSVYENDYAGEIPFWLTENTRYLELGENKFTGDFTNAKVTDSHNNQAWGFSNCLLTGSIPAAVLESKRLLILDLSGNNLDAIEPWTKIDTLRYLLMSNNRFTFEDIEPFITGWNPRIGWDSYLEYAPQQNIYSAATLTLQEGATLTLKTVAGGTANNYQWFKDDAAIGSATATTYSKQLALSDAGVYTSKVSSTLVPDLTLDRNPVTVQVEPNKIYTSCDGSIVVLDAKVADESATYLWSNGQTTASITPVVTGLYSVRVETSNFIIEDSYQVNSVPLNLGNDVNTCEQTVKLLSNVLGADSYEWQTPAGTITGVDELVITTSGTYSLTIVVGGCSQSQTDVVEVEVNKFTEGSFTISSLGVLLQDEAVILPAIPLTFTNTTLGVGSGNFNWSLGDGFITSEIQPLHAYENVGTYTVSLTGVDSRGCPISATKIIEVKDIVITTAISPNGDSKNDKLFIEPLLFEASLKVVDRDGKTVFEASPYHDDFTGKNLESGVYYYELHFREIDRHYKGAIHVIK